MIKKNIRYLIYLVSIPIIYLSIKLFFNYSHSRMAYSLISSFWYALYLSALLDLKLKELRYIFFISFIFSILYYITEYHDAVFILASVLKILILSIVFMIPYFVNCFVSYLISKIKNDKI